ncbi:MAG TPA: LamG-like jellyroll fold domain-containing protein [Polyangia bacterium]
MAAGIALALTLMGATASAGNSCTWHQTSGNTFATAANWNSCGGVAPGAADAVVFDGTSTAACTIAASISVASISINSGYGGTITQSSGQTVTVTGVFAQATGTFTGGNSAITIGGNLNLSGGTFTSTSGLLQIAGAFNATGGTFTHNSGQVMLNATSSQTFATNGVTFNNLTVNDGLVGYWKLDETTIGTASDASGYGYDGTHVNTPSSSTSVPSTIDFADSHSLNYGSTASARAVRVAAVPSNLKPSTLTVSAWYKAVVGDIGGSGSDIVTDGDNWKIRVVNNGYLQFYKRIAGSTSVPCSSNPAALLDGNWHHIAGTISATTMVCYFDGAVINTVSDSNAVVYDLGTDLYIGRHGNGSTQFNFGGSIDDVRVYNRPLSAAEIYVLSTGHQPGTGLATQTMTGAPILAGDLVIASGALAVGANNLTVGGSWWNYGGLFTSSANTVTLNGSGTNFLRSGGQLFSNLTFSGAGSMTLNDRVETDPGSVVNVSTGTFDLSSYTLRTGDINRGAAITITPSSGRVVFDANAAHTIDTGTYNNLNIEPVTATELVGYWKLDDGQGLTARDYSGSGLTGTLTNGPLWIDSGLPGAISFEDPAALTLAGASTQYVVTGTMPTALKPAIVTMSAWYKATSIDTNGGEVVSGSNRYALRVFSSTQIKVVKQTAASTWVELAATVSSPLDGNWHHIAGVITSSGMTAYFDGAAVGSNADTTAIYYTSATGVYLGQNPGATGYKFTGSIDDVRVYGSALTAKQIGALAAGTYPAGLSAVPTYTIGYNSTVSGTFTQDGGTLDTSSYTMNVSSTASAAAVNSGTYTLGSAASTFSGGLTVGRNATLGMASSGGALKVGSAKVLTIDGTFNASSTGATIQTAGSAGTYYTFKVGSTAVATPTLNITGLAVQNTDSNGMYINANNSATTTFTRFDSIAFSAGTGTQLLQIYAPTLYLVSNGCTFDSGATASTTYDVTLTGNGSATETRAVFGNATCASNKTSCEAYDNDDDAGADGIGDTVATNAAVVQWVRAADSDTNGTIEGFPTAAFDWNTFTYYSTYVLYHDVDGGTADRIYVRDTNGNARYTWDGPSSADFIGTPRFNTVSSVHYVYVATNSGKVYRLIDNGSSLALDGSAAWTTNPYDCSCAIVTPLAMDTVNLYWGGTQSAATKVWEVTQAGASPAASYPVSLGGAVSFTSAAPAIWTNVKTYMFAGLTGHFFKYDFAGAAITTDNTSPVGAVNGRLTIVGSKVYGNDNAGTLWVLDPTSFGTTLWSYHDNTNHSGCAVASVCAVTGSTYVDWQTNRAFYGDGDGHLYASYNSTGTTGVQMTSFPMQPGSSADVFATAPLYDSGVLVAGTTTGNVYVVDINGGSGPVLLQTYKLGTSTKVSGVGYDKGSASYMISTANATNKDGRLFYIAATGDPTPGAN